MCGEEFPTKHDRAMHEKEHDVGADSGISCEDCGRNFSSEENLELHMEKHHTGENEQSTEKPDHTLVSLSPKPLILHLADKQSFPMKPPKS